MQSSNRSGSRRAVGSPPAVLPGHPLAQPQQRVLWREALDEGPHVDDDVGEHRDVGERLDRHGVGRHRRHAREALAPVHAHAARAARGVEAAVADHERAVRVHLDPAKALQHRRGLPSRDVELVDVTRAVLAPEAMHTESAGGGVGAAHAAYSAV